MSSPTTTRPVVHTEPHKPPVKPLPQPAQTHQPDPAEQANVPNHPQPATLRRAEPIRWAGVNTATNNGDSLFFEQLMGTDPFMRQGSSSDSDSDSDSQSGMSSSQNAHGLTSAGLSQLVDELSLHLPMGSDQAFSATLFMPNMGRIGLKANQQSGRWNIELGFANLAAHERVKASHGDCQQALANALGCPVDLRVHAL